MTDVPKPSGYDVYWEKWIDAFEAEEEAFEEDIPEELEHLLGEDIADQEHIVQSISHIRSILTPFGVLPLTEQTMASKYFKFWVGHANFKLTQEFYNVIGQHPGIETLDILTPYRFRIAVGQMFTDRDVMTGVRDTMVNYVSTQKKDLTLNDSQED